MFFCHSLNGKIDEAVEGYKEAKAIFKEMKEFCSGKYTQTLIYEVIEGLTVMAITLRNFSIWFNNYLSILTMILSLILFNLIEEIIINGKVIWFSRLLK